jgi:hypothetical protein
VTGPNVTEPHVLRDGGRCGRRPLSRTRAEPTSLRIASGSPPLEELLVAGGSSLPPREPIEPAAAWIRP